MQNPDFWEKYRKEFPMLNRVTYLNSCSLGALSQRSIDGINQFLELWSSFGAMAWWRAWLEELDRLRARFANLIWAKKEEIALSPCISVALSSVASLFDYRKKNKVVTTELDFPTMPYQWMVKSRSGVELDIIKSPDGIMVPLELYEKHVDDQTILVATSHVFYDTGYTQEIGSIGEIAHRRGAYLLVDAYQSTGVVPVKVGEAGPDFLCSGALKWLLGGPGMAFLYVRHELIRNLKPSITGWFACQNQFSFDSTNFEYASDARRFELGTPAVAAAYSASAAMEIILEVGVDAINERVEFLVNKLIDKASALGFEPAIPQQPGRRSGIVMLPCKQAGKTVEALLAKKIIVDHRKGQIRVSPHFYNREEEIDLFLEELKKIQAQL